mmetsp:Transcript_16640/g.52026  ORF Transcript_16640/g.52026 Transcript_16640/m.52026 type:complete len:428 (+) Transcript_16640:386-1669(+)
MFRPHLNEGDATGEDVGGCAVSPVLHHLGWHPKGGPEHGAPLRLGNVAAQPKVDNLDARVAAQHDVGTLQVAVHNVSVVHEDERLEDAGGDVRGRLLGEGAHGRDGVRNRPTLQVLHDHPQLVFPHVALVQLDHIFVLAVEGEANLPRVLPNFLGVGVRHLLDGHLCLCLVRHHHVHRTKATLANQLSVAEEAHGVDIVNKVGRDVAAEVPARRSVQRLAFLLPRIPEATLAHKLQDAQHEKPVGINFVFGQLGPGDLFEQMFGQLFNAAGIKDAVRRRAHRRFHDSGSGRRQRNGRLTNGGRVSEAGRRTGHSSRNSSSRARASARRTVAGRLTRNGKGSRAPRTRRRAAGTRTSTNCHRRSFLTNAWCPWRCKAIITLKGFRSVLVCLVCPEYRLWALFEPPTKSACANWPGILGLWCCRWLPEW